MARAYLKKRWIFIKGVLGIVLLVYLAQFVVVHIPNFQKHNLFHSNSGIFDISLGKYYATLAVTRKRELDIRQAFSHLLTYRGSPVEYTYNITNSQRTKVWKMKYENFNLPAPHFASENSSKLFFKNVDNRNFIGLRPKELLKGELYIVKNGTYAANFDCGYKSDPGHVLASRNIPRSNWYRKAVAFYSPEAWTFQHFMDGALPKIVQALDLVRRDPNITILFRRTPRDKIISEILIRLNMTRHKIKYETAREFGADEFYFTCITPPIHPALWQSARRLIGVPETLTRPIETSFVLFVTRKGCVNCGRVVRNENQIVTMLLKRYGESRVKIFRGGLGLNDVIDLFGNARIVMGSHGGGMYNINFAPINTTVIEFMPTHPDGKMDAASKKIIWSQASILGQIYWRMAVAPLPGSRGDMIINLKELEDILEKTDKTIKPEVMKSTKTAQAGNS